MLPPNCVHEITLQETILNDPHIQNQLEIAVAGQQFALQDQVVQTEGKPGIHT